MNYPICEKIFAIRHKETGNLIRTNNKGCWMSVAAAKSSWNSMGWYENRTKFSEQDDFEIIDLLAILAECDSNFQIITDEMVDMEMERSKHSFEESY